LIGRQEESMPLPESPKPAPFSTAQEFAFVTLREWILQGSLRPGETLRDVGIAEHLGIGRTPVREALIRLSQEGLVESARGRRTTVADLRVDQAAKLFEVGTVLDPYAAQVATRKLQPQDLQKLHRLAKEMQTERDPRLLAEIDREFHMTYYRRTGNEILVMFLERVTDDLMRFERQAWARGDDHVAAREEHLTLIEAFERGDEKGAAQAATDNWQHAWGRLSAMLGNHAAKPGPAAPEPPE
jgi:DNA-binding GntR family transcriptional regulator